MPSALATGEEMERVRKQLGEVALLRGSYVQRVKKGALWRDLEPGVHRRALDRNRQAPQVARLHGELSRPIRGLSAKFGAPNTRALKPSRKTPNTAIRP